MIRKYIIMVSVLLLFGRYEDNQGRIDKKKRDAVLTARYVEEVLYYYLHIHTCIHTCIHTY